MSEKDSKKEFAKPMQDEVLHGIQYRAVTDMEGSDRKLLLAEVERLRAKAAEPYTVHGAVGKPVR